ncbi:ABC transporter ATP-binding protein [Aureimonas populi]|uniref:ABC transporter ATP-binding protein n=1 Tax=Aureimonas populi TaxID=1701758 RepID=A0ABW5CTK5_9HYPH|nr:ATP-binding cassette domain-containing protein [Aureimonas populi]
MPEGPAGAPGPAAEWRGVSIAFPHAGRAAVGPVSLALARGERVLLLGPSGSGKSSLLLALTGLVPHSVPATVEGETFILGAPSASRPPAGWSDAVAHYFQDADQVLCGMRVKDEIAFSGENRGLAPEAIEARVKEVSALLGLPADWLGRRSLALSGGERQLVALAAVLAQDAPILIADEPTAHLSPEVAARLHALLASTAPCDAVLVVDHRLDGMIEAMDRVVVLGRSGTVLAQGAPRAIFRAHHAALVREGVWRPAASDLDACLIAAGLTLPHPPLTMEEALAALPRSEAARAGVASFLGRRLPPPRTAPSGPPVARLRGADCAPFLAPAVLHGVDIGVRGGEVLALLGRNGAGKSTLGASLAGLLRLKAGRREGPPGAIALQHAEDHFATGCVRDEIAAMLPRAMDGGDRQAAINAAIEAYGLSGLEDRHPFTLSEGQKRRLSLAAIDAADRWPLIVLDEPTAGLDAAGVDGLALRIEALRAKGRALVLITHDMDFALRLCDRAALLGGGRLLAEGPARDLLLDAGLMGECGLGEPAGAPALRWLEGRC